MEIIDKNQLSFFDDDYMIIKDLNDNLAKSSKKIIELQKNIDSIKNIINNTNSNTITDTIDNIDTPSAINWRKNTTIEINRIANKLGGFKNINKVRTFSYTILQNKLGIDLNLKLKNAKARAKKYGYTKTYINKMNMLDVIQENESWILQYVKVVESLKNPDIFKRIPA